MGETKRESGETVIKRENNGETERDRENKRERVRGSERQRQKGREREQERWQTCSILCVRVSTRHKGTVSANCAVGHIACAFLKFTSCRSFQSSCCSWWSVLPPATDKAEMAACLCFQDTMGQFLNSPTTNRSQSSLEHIVKYFVILFNIVKSNQVKYFFIIFKGKRGWKKHSWSKKQCWS